MSEKVKVKGRKTMNPAPERRQGRYRWVYEYADNTVISKYNEDGTKNRYAGREDGKAKVFIPLTGVTSAGFTDADGNVVTVIDVPEGATVFQRRRVTKINYFNRFHEAEVIIPEGVRRGRWWPEKRRMKMFPEINYEEVWIIGWHKREDDGSITTYFKACYPRGPIDEYSEWGLKKWLYELEWLPHEMLDDADMVAQADRMSVKHRQNIDTLLTLWRDTVAD